MCSRSPIIALVIFCLVSCGAPITPSPPPPSSTPVIEKTSTPTFTPLPTATPTFTATPTPTETSQPTWTPLPTLPPEDAEALVLDLLANNAGCQLPCWWGITPGQTTWQEARSFLATFALDIDIYPTGPSDNSFHEVYIHVPEEISPVRLRHIYTVKDGIIEKIEVETGNSLHYWLHLFLSRNGQPGEVWLQTGPEPWNGYLWFSIALFYSDKGIVIRYDEPFAKVKGDQVEGCPHKYLVPAIVLWAPEHKVTFDEAIAWIDPDGRYLPLEEATGMDMKTFYETFKDLEHATCLKTPVKLWPWR